MISWPRAIPAHRGPGEGGKGTVGFERLRALIVKEFIQVLRDRITLVIIIAMPIIQLVVFGFAINTDVKHLRTAVFDQSRSQESREMLRGFTSSNYFDVVLTAESMEEVNDAVASGRAKVGILFPPDYARNIRGGRPAQVQVLVDATDNLSASSAIAAAQMLGVRRSQAILIEKMVAAGQPVLRQAVDVRVRSWYNPDFITSWYMVPGIMGILLTITLVAMMSMAIVRESEQGTLEQLLVTPMRSWELLVSKVLPYIIVGYVQVSVSLVIGTTTFGMPFEGSRLLFLALTLLFVLASLSMGIMISTFVQNQMQALQLSVFVILPSVLLSGFVFPIEAMPPLFRVIGGCLPITYYMRLSRQIILKGGGMEYVWVDALALVAFVLVLFSTSLVLFRKRFVP